MTLHLFSEQHTILARWDDPQGVLRTAQDAVELLMNARYQGSDRLIIGQEQLAPAFFELSSGLAGDILQKFSTYGGYLAIIGDFSGYTRASWRAFMTESNRMGRIHFVADLAEAKRVLTQ